MAGNYPGRREKMCIRKLKPTCCAEENLRINAHRNMLMARHSYQSSQRIVLPILKRMDHCQDSLERTDARIEEGTLSERYHTISSRELERAKNKYKIASALESERKSMRDLTQEIYNLSEIDERKPTKMKEYLVAKRKLLQSGYNLAISQASKKKAHKELDVAKALYESSKKCNSSILSGHTEHYNMEMQRIAELKENPASSYYTLENIASQEKSYTDRYQGARNHCYNNIIKAAKAFMKTKDDYKRACLKLVEFQNQQAAAEKMLDDAFHEYTKFMNNEEYKPIEEEYLGASGIMCEKCEEAWFWKVDACVNHEDVICKGKVEPPKVNMSVEHINPENGHYKYGAKKCSKCKEIKGKGDFTEEEGSKKADKRVCYCCMDRL